jgi:hypothetical protein
VHEGYIRDTCSCCADHDTRIPNIPLFATHPTPAPQPAPPTRPTPYTIPIYRVELVRERGIPTAQPQFRSSAEVARLLHAVLAGVDSGALSTGM